MSEYSIRAASAEHIPFLAAIEQRAASLFPAGSIPDHIRSDTLPPDLVYEGVRNGNLWVVLDAGGIPVGYALVRFVEGLALLAQIDVLPEHGRKGLGTRLIREAAQWAGEQGYERLYLTTFTHVPWNAPFYARLGFRTLHEGNTPDAIRAILGEERDYGLENRVGMELFVKDMQ